MIVGKSDQNPRCARSSQRKARYRTTPKPQQLHRRNWYHPNCLLASGSDWPFVVFENLRHRLQGAICRRHDASLRWSLSVGRIHIYFETRWFEMGVVTALQSLQRGRARAVSTKVGPKERWPRQVAGIPRVTRPPVDSFTVIRRDGAQRTVLVISCSGAGYHGCPVGFSKITVFRFELSPPRDRAARRDPLLQLSLASGIARRQTQGTHRCRQSLWRTWFATLQRTVLVLECLAGL